MSICFKLTLRLVRSKQNMGLLTDRRMKGVIERILESKCESFQKLMYGRFLIVLSSLVGLVLIGCLPVAPALAFDGGSHHLVVLGDPHLPGKNIKVKERVLETINSWVDVEMVVAVGDICERYGNRDEYAAATQFFDKLKKPFSAIVGNHDYLYDDEPSSTGRVQKGTYATRQAKLEKFRKTFRLSKLCYTQNIGGYLLIFLSHMGSRYSSELLESQLGWLRAELKKHSRIPTIIFFHAPLIGTLRDYNRLANTPNYVAQPSAQLHDILMENKQVFLWVSGHTHTALYEESFASKVNLYGNSITNIHNTDMNRKTIWTNSLFLDPDRIIVKTYNHKKSVWLPNLERTFLAPNLEFKSGGDLRIDAPPVIKTIRKQPTSNN